MFKIYRNLHKHCYSVLVDGVVAIHTDTFVSCDVRLHVIESGRQRVLDTRTKNVHAFVCCDTLLVPQSAVLRPQFFLGARREHASAVLAALRLVTSEVITSVFESATAELTYNPYTHNQFKLAGKPVSRARYVAGIVIRHSDQKVQTRMCTFDPSRTNCEHFSDKLVLV